MSVNNFKELEKEQIEKFDSSRKKQVKNNIDSSLGVFQFIGDIFGLYIPKVMGIFVRMSGGSNRSQIDNSEKSKKYPNQ